MNKIRKKFSMLCASCMLLSSISIPVVADTRMPNTNLYALTSDVTYLSVEVSKNVVQYYLDSVYEEEQFEKNELYTITDKYNLVYNIDNQQIGYLFRIINKSNEEIGYIIAGNNNEVSTVFEACIGNLFAKDLSGSEKLYYISPLNLAIESNDQLRSVQSGKLIDLSNINLLTKEGRQINKELKKNEWDTLLDVLDNSGATTSSQITLQDTKASHTTYSVYSEADFVNIDDRFYGGNQSWYTSPYKTGNSCGAVAAANMMAYLAKEYFSYSDLYAYSDLDNSYFSKTNFLSHMETMYDYLSPTIIGVSSLSQFRNGVNDYMYDTLGRRISYDEFTVSRYSTIVDGLIDGLIEKVPVALLVLDVENGSSGDLEGSDGDSFAMHWITITKYFKDGNTSDEQIAFSSWGYRYSVPLYDFWYIYDIEGGIYYF